MGFERSGYLPGKVGLIKVTIDGGIVGTVGASAFVV